MEFLSEYFMFFLKSATWLFSFVIAFALIVGILVKSKGSKNNSSLNVRSINEEYDEYKQTIQSTILNEETLKVIKKSEKKKEKEKSKKQKKEAKKKLLNKSSDSSSDSSELEQDKPAETPEQTAESVEKDDSENPMPDKPFIFVLNFHGDIRASEVDFLREEITAILSCEQKPAEILVILHSSGGMVNTYGLAASQLSRIREANIPLTIAIDEVAASGGYMMASVANRIIGSPFAIVGSIGVIAQIPNFHRLLKKHDIDFEQITAGEFKRTLTMFGENTDNDRAKMQEDINQTHTLFKNFIQKYRPSLDLSKTATGEYWFGEDALNLGLIDEIITSDDYLMQKRKDFDLYEVEYTCKEPLSDKISHFLKQSFKNITQRSPI